MLRLAFTLIFLTLAGCDIGIDDSSCSPGSFICSPPACRNSGASELMLSGSITDFIQGNAWSRVDETGVSFTLSDDNGSSTLRVYLPGSPTTGRFVVGDEVTVRYLPGSAPYTSVTGTVTLTRVSTRGLIGRLDLDTAFVDDEPSLNVAGTFRTETC